MATLFHCTVRFHNLFTHPLPLLLSVHPRLPGSYCDIPSYPRLLSCHSLLLGSMQFYAERAYCGVISNVSKLRTCSRTIYTREERVFRRHGVWEHESLYCGVQRQCRYNSLHQQCICMIFLHVNCLVSLQWKVMQLNRMHTLKLTIKLHACHRNYHLARKCAAMMFIS